MLDAVQEAQLSGRAPLTHAQMEAELGELASLRGRPAFTHISAQVFGRGARAMLSDGRWVIDLRGESAFICLVTAIST